MLGLLPVCIGLLLFFAVLRLLTVNQESADIHHLRLTRQTAHMLSVDLPLLGKVIAAQLLLPIGLFFAAGLAGLAWHWIMALTLVAAASPISGSPNLVQLLGGDDQLTLQWLVIGTALLPLSCLPVMYLLFPDQSPFMLLFPSVKLLALIGGAVLAALCVSAVCRHRGRRLSPLSIDGAASLTLALMVVGLMSAIHAPGSTSELLFTTLLAACAINGGLQLFGVLASRANRQPPAALVASGVICGNRNIALFLAALPLSVVEPLLLFIACYQIPMYLTPLIGDPIYRRLR
jgi:hypothetical protein